MTSNLAALFDNAKKVALVNVPTKEEPIKDVVEEENFQPKKKKPKQQELEHEDRSVANAETVFVGNVPVGCTPKELKRLFSEFGTVKSVRLRNLIPQNPKRGKRLAFIKKELHPLQKTVTAFIRFTNESDARQATCLNGYVYKEHHLRVDMAHETDKDTKHDNKRSIFIGNLPFDASDDDVWKAFEECGEIESVRLIRDTATSVGKGFGYVLFHDEASVALALRMNDNCKVGNRSIRIKPAVKKPKRVRPQSSPNKHRRESQKLKSRKSFRSDTGQEGVKEGRVEKRPAVKLRKQKQKLKKKNPTTKTNNTRKDVIQLKKTS